MRSHFTQLLLCVAATISLAVGQLDSTYLVYIS